MTDRDPIAACIEARARDLHAALADAVGREPHWRFHAHRLLAEIEAAAVLSVNAAIAAQKPAASAISPPPYTPCHQPTVCAGLGYCPHLPTCNV